VKKIFISFYIITAALSLSAQETVQKLDELVAAYAKNESFNGTVLVAQNGKILLQKGYGYKNADKKEMNDGNTIFQIGSITKQFTSALILHLQEQKKLSIHDKVSKYFPALPFADSVTIENLLTHTSGIYNYTNNENFMKNEAVKPTSQEKIFALFKDKPLEFQPGSKFNYSNSGYMLLGYIVEKVTGKPYEKAMHETIFTPLHMDHSGFDFVALSSPDKATGYFALTNATNTPATVVDSSVSFAAGAIYTTVGDLYKWDRSLYTEKIISKASLKDAYTPRKSKYGFGWFIDSVYGKPIYKHGGGIFGFTTNILRDPGDDICIILLDNKGDGGLEKITGALNAILHNTPYELPKEKKEITVDSLILKQYVGDYQLAPNFILSITFENARLMVTATGQGKTALYAEKNDFFFSKVVDAQIEFTKDADGKADKLILHQNGRDTPAKKITPGDAHNLPKERTAIKVDAALLKQYVGEYELAPNFVLAVTLEDGKLMSQATGQTKVEMFAEKENFFFLKVVDAQIEFTKDADGKTDKLILHQNGRDMPAKKIK
jgi:CubicO group peptidase (beta-lactamase class C family)